MDLVKGPYWSHILALFGFGGTLSEALKHRSDVEQQDKALSCQMFLLKSGNEIHFYLQLVSGAQAVKRAVKDSAEEDAAHAAPATALVNEAGDSGPCMGTVYGENPHRNSVAHGAAGE
jgi:hypothetical protein